MNPRLMQHAEPLPGYRLIERLGKGGYGEVWKAEAPGGLFKAIKFVYGDLEGAGDETKAAEQELKSLHRIKTIRHPFILSIERFDVIDGQLMIVMELADRNLWDRFDECRKQGLVGVPRSELLRYLEESAEALDLMNNHYQIQHLDVKPQNLFLVHNHIKVADFGLAKDFEGIRAKMTGGVTPVYAAPETFEGWASRFCDQYSLAIVYQELLTGIRPFSGTNTRQLVLQHVSGIPDVAPLPVAERDIVARALSKRPEDRHPSCADFVQLLRGTGSATVHGGGSVVAPSVDTAPTLPNNKWTPGLDADKPSAPGVRPQAARLTSPALRTLPKLVTPGRHTPAGPPTTTPEPVNPAITLQRPLAFETSHLSKLGIPAPERSGPGVLLPVYVIAAGQAGLQIVQQLRSRLQEQFGRPDLPHWRWLFIDTDSQTIEAATADTTGQALTVNEVYHARLQRPGQYLKNEALPPTEAWLSNDMLHRMPREPATAGIRSLGRLAFCDHYRALAARIRQDLETFVGESGLAEAERLTKLGLRNNRPRIYVAASLAGGTGSGMLIDLAYLVRREMKQIGYSKPHLIGVLLVPSMDRSMPKTHPVANAYGALAELHYFSRPDTRYEARLIVREAPVIDSERPFERCVLLRLPTVPGSGPPPGVGRAASLVFQETLTPLGRTLDDARTAYQERRRPAGLPLQSFGCYRITWPRQQLLDIVSNRFAGQLVRHWCSAGASSVRRAATWFETQWTERGLAPTALASALESAAAKSLGDNPRARIDVAVSAFPREINPSARADRRNIGPAIEQILELLGRPGKEEETAPGRVAGVLDGASQTIEREMELQFARMAVYFIEQPQYRLAAAGEVIRLGTERLNELLGAVEHKVAALGEELEREYAALLPMFGSGSSHDHSRTSTRRSLAPDELGYILRNWPAKRLDYLIARRVGPIYRKMISHVPEYLREVASCRQFLVEMADTFDARAQAAGGVTTTDHPMLPSGCRTLAEAADRFMADLPPDAAAEFEEKLQANIKKNCRALVTACLDRHGLGERLKLLLAAESREYLEPMIGGHAPATEFFRRYADEQTAARAVMFAYDESDPESFGPMPPPDTECFVLGSSSDQAGQRLARLAREQLPDLQNIRAFPTDEIVFYREYHDLSWQDLPQLSAQAAEAAREVQLQDRIDPHSRTDIRWSAPAAE